jgi:hypothetical protein
MVCFREPIFQQAVELPFNFKTPQVPETLGGREYDSKTAICQHTTIFPQEKWWHVRAPTGWKA